jgi:non-ribosomal peptide synthase protein (TIGR01720 family)
LGRLDDQVKIRGFRVELGEIATVLSQHPAIAQAMVVHHRPSPDQSCLVAYYTPAIVSPETLRAFVQTRLPSYLIPTHFVGLDSLPLTVNGKLDQRILPLPDLNQRSTAILAPTTDLEHTLVEIWQTVLKLDTLSLTDNFFELGGDSILAIQLVSRINQAGWQITPKQLFQFPTIAELSAIVTPLAASDPEPAVITGGVALTPIQNWFLSQNLPNPNHFNQAVLLEVSSPWTRDRLHTALRHLLHHHDALRLRLEMTDGGWKQEIMSPRDRVPLTWWDGSDLTEAQQHSQIQQTAEQMQASLNLSTGELVRVAYFDGGDRPHRLLVVIHHWAIDGVSWRILLEDLQQLDQQLRQGEVPQLPPKTTSFQRWADRLQTVADTGDWSAEREYWQQVVQQPIKPLPVDLPSDDNRQAIAAQVRLSLSPEQTASLLRTVPAAYNTQITEVLLWAIAHSFQAWTGESTRHFDLESHGRSADFAEDLNFSRTVGWFTSLFPVCLTMPNSANLGTALIAIKEQVRAIPQQGIGYGILRYLTARSDAASLTSPAEVSVNYLGQIDRPAASSVASSAIAATSDRRNPHSHRLEIVGAVQANQLYLEWHYSQQQYHPETIATLANHCIQALQQLIHHCQTLDTSVYSPSDFDLTDFDLDPLNQAQLDQILASVEFAPIEFAPTNLVRGQAS